MKTIPAMPYSPAMPLAGARFLPHVVTMLVGRADEPHRVMTRVIRSERAFSAWSCRRHREHTRCTVMHPGSCGQDPRLIRYCAGADGIMRTEAQTVWQTVRAV